MPMEKDVHENLLNELLSADIETSRKTEILQELRADYTNVLNDFTDLTSSNERLQKDNDDLVVSNSKLFREIGIVGQGQEKQEEEKQKDFSETVSLESIEGGAI